RTTAPPSPPSPPSGPPFGTYFSRRNETLPAPPSPARTRMRTSSRNVTSGLPARERGAAGPRRRAPFEDRSGPGSVRLGERVDVDPHPLAALEPDRAVDRREDRVVAAERDVQAGVVAGPDLPDEDRPRGHRLTGVPLDPSHLRVGVASVARRTLSLLVRHDEPLESRVVTVGSDLDRGDPDLRELLTVTEPTAVVLPSLVLHDEDLVRLVESLHFGLDGDAVEDGGPDPAIGEQDLAEAHGGARLEPGALDEDPVALGHAVLVATVADDRVHHNLLWRNEPGKLPGRPVRGKRKNGSPPPRPVRRPRPASRRGGRS